jgi:hypothetical protein
MLEELFAWHTPNGGFRNRIEAARFKAMGVVPGVPDVLLLHEGRLRGLELKRKGGRLTPTQVACHAAMRRAGAEIAVAYDVDEALAQLQQWGVLR